jgi:hypothetical protein
MINLIPNEEKKRSRRSFYVRLLVIFFFMISITIFIASVAILPSYVLSSAKKIAANYKLESQKKEPIPPINKETLATIHDLDEKLILIEKSEKNKYEVSKKVIDEIIKQKMYDIEVTLISYRDDPQNGKGVEIHGVAPSRERLLLFRQALQEDPSFQSVDLPISNFVKGSNIQFSLSLMPI